MRAFYLPDTKTYKCVAIIVLVPITHGTVESQGTDPYLSGTFVCIRSDNNSVEREENVLIKLLIREKIVYQYANGKN